MSTVRPVALVCIAFAGLPGPEPAVAQMLGAEYATCREQPRDSAMIACLNGRTTAWDARLAKAVRELRTRMDKDQRAPLAEAQKAWERYRDTNCRFYAARDGSIRTIHAMECRRAMTEARAIEIEKAMTEE